jgi:hypothetical protein
MQIQFFVFRLNTPKVSIKGIVKCFLSLLLPLLFSQPLFAQQDRIYSAFDLSKPASFPGGNYAWHLYLKDHLLGPIDSQSFQPVSRTILSFVVEADGSFSKVRVVQPVNDACRNKLLQFVQQMPKWVPAEANGHSVRQHIWMFFYVHPHTRQIYFIGEGCLDYPDKIRQLYALPDQDLYKTVPAMKATLLRQEYIPLQIPEAAKRAKVNVEAAISYKISADGLLHDAKIEFDPGYGCGAAAKEYIENQKYWAPKCLYDTCFVEEKRAVISFVTDTVALLQSDKIYEPAQLLDYDFRDTMRMEYSGLQYGTTQSGWISYTFIHEKDGHNTNLEFENTTDSMLLVNAFSEAQWLFHELGRGPTATYCGFPCRTFEKRYMYCSVKDEMKAVYNFRPVNPGNLSRHAIYQLEEVDVPPTHPYGAYWVQHITNKIWEYPPEALKDKIEGTVLIQLEITEKGIVYPKVIQDIGGGCGEAACQALNQGFWRPAIKGGWPVSTRFTVPVVFQLPH